MNIKNGYLLLKTGALSICLFHISALAEQTMELDDLDVHPRTSRMTNTVLQAEDQQGGSGLNAAELATQVPGVTSINRGANAAEPVIRGLGWERVTTQVGSHSLYGSCPSRMDPPGTYISPESIEEVEIVKGIPSVTLGPGSTGGRLILKSDYDRGDHPEPGYIREGHVLWNEGREGYSAGLQVKGGSVDTDIKAGVNAADFGDYKSADGTTVPAGITEYGANLSLGIRPNDLSRVFGHVQYKRAEDVDYPSLPMDTEKTDSSILTLGYRINPEGSSFDRVEMNVGYSHVDHLMNNKNKTNRKKLEAETPSTADTVSVKVDGDWWVDQDKHLTVGIDGQYLERDALRTRHILASGATFKDAIWPDINQSLIGVFSELDWSITEPFSIRTGARVDYAASDAKAVDEVIVLGPGNSATIRDRYIEFNGPEADTIDRDDVLFSANLIGVWKTDGPWSTKIGFGRIERYPAATELYFAFAPAPGGYQVGNPELDTEKKYDINIGAQFNNGSFSSELSTFYSHVEDYILQTSLSQSDINGDGSSDRLRGFRNIDAELYGGELITQWMMTDEWSLPASLAYVRGRNKDDDGDLPEIPPLSGTVDLQYQSHLDSSGWVRFGVLFAARQNKVDPAFPENETSSYSVWHLRGGVDLTEQIAFEAGVENLFDKQYNDHLTREALLPTEDLKPGDEIPAIGRYVYAKLSCTF